MKIGKLNKRVEIRKKQYSKDRTGAEIFMYNPVWQTWAYIRPLSAKEVSVQDQIRAIATHKITVRYNSEIKESDIVFYNDREFEINGIINFDESNKYLELLCSELRRG